MENFFELDYGGEHSLRGHTWKLTVKRCRLQLRRCSSSQRVVNAWNKLPSYTFKKDWMTGVCMQNRIINQRLTSTNIPSYYSHRHGVEPATLRHSSKYSLLFDIFSTQSIQTIYRLTTVTLTSAMQYCQRMILYAQFELQKIFTIIVQAYNNRYSYQLSQFLAINMTLSTIA